jgi:protein phosphatase
VFDLLKRIFKSAANGRPAESQPGAGRTTPLSTSHATAPLVTPDATIGSDSPIRMAHSQSVGRVRDHNEDVLLTLTSTFEGDEKMPSFGLYVVADGMGGHSLGERASSVAARTVAREVTKRIYLALLDDSDNSERPPLQQVVEEALAEANRAVVKAVGEGGTTGTVALIFNDQLIIGHVGDSRAYLITNTGIEQLTRDHSLVQRLVELGQLSPAEAAIHNQKNVLYKAIGQGEGLEADVTMHRLAPGTKILLCSDGLWGYVDESHLLNIVRQAPSLKLACDKMVNAANEAGGPDNITAVLIEYNP